MARQPRVYIEGALYYVTSQSGHSEKLFMDDKDYVEYVSLVAKYKDQYGFQLFAYVLLPTHLHMLVELKNNIGISNIMHDINSLYTKIYNGKYSKKGHLFQERFKTVLAEKEEYLLPLTRYIHLNPRRERLAEEPRDYPNSSHTQFLDPSKRQHPNMGIEIEEVFYRLKGREREFDEYVKAADPKDGELKKLLHKKRILGSAAFIDRIRGLIDETIEQQKQSAAPKKMPLFYTVFGGVVILALTVLLGYFYKQSAALKTEYNTTLGLYRKTLKALETEKETALRQDKQIEQYIWKIKLTEEAIKELEDEKKAVNGYIWRIELTPMGGHATGPALADTLYFADNKVFSYNLNQEAFPASNYSRREESGGMTVWETMQVDGSGNVANWHGEWDGSIMRGVLSKRSATGEVMDYSFVSKGERIKK